MKNLIELIRKLSTFFNREEKKKWLLILFLMIFAAIFETMSIGLIVPIVGIVTNPEIIEQQPVLLFTKNLFNIESGSTFITISIFTLLFVFVAKNIYLLFFQYLQNKIVLNQQVKLSGRLFRAYLTKPYSFHLHRNTAELLRNVNGEVSRVFQGIILASFHLVTELLIVTCIVCLLLFNALEATISASFLLGGSVILFLKFFRKKTQNLGKEQQLVSGEMIKWVNQGLGASKEVKVSGKEDFFINSYMKQSIINAKNNVYMRMLDIFPRYFIETILVATILITMLIIISQNSDTTRLVSTMALFAMAAFRLMPSISRIVGLITSIRYSQPALSVVYEDLISSDRTELINKENSRLQFTNIEKNKRHFRDSIMLSDISFRYPNQENYSVKDVSLSIPIGQAVAFIGESGAGKTTVVDIILGLFSPEKGKVLVDNINLNEQKEIWQRKIGYIPQSIYLSDDTIRGNVAFGIGKESIDDVEVWRALEQAQLKEFVESLPDQLDTFVGERGVRLSGGQRQRVGIARALYHDPEILFMDEATSALDNETEKEIMKAIDGLKGEKTLIIIAHRLSTIENCDIVYKMNKGRLVSINNKLVQTS